MKILLVNPATGHTSIDKPRQTYSTMPNGLLYIASLLEEHGHNVRVYDNNVDLSQPEDFVDFSPAIVGFAVLTGPGIIEAIEQSIKFKKLLPDTKIVWGNVHPSVLPEQVLAEPYVDFVVIGPGEYTLLDLASSLEEGTPSLSQIRGLAYRKNYRVVINDPRPFIPDLNEMPDPAWHLVDVKSYSVATLNTSRGCPFHCTFCYNIPFNKGYRAALSAERVVAQMEHLRERYGVKYIRFFEDNFCYDRQRLKEFCHLLIEKKLNIKWDTETRADLNEEEVSLMAKAGCTSVGMGIETGSQRLLDFLCKGVELATMEKTFWLFVKYKIAPRLYLMEKVPTENVEDFQKTQELLKRLDNPPYIFMSYIPYPGTPLFIYCLRKELITPPSKTSEWGKFTIDSAVKANLSQVPDDTVNQALALFRKNYAWQRLRFTMKHNPAYFWSIILRPRQLFKDVKSLAFCSLPYLKDKVRL